jgi:DNA-binding NarL/FixJ family response regulator
MAAQQSLSVPLKKHRVLLVDDHPVVRCGLANLLGNEPDLEICGQAADVSEALQEVERTTPDLVIIDLALRGGHGIDLIEKIKARDERVKMLVSSMHDETLFAERVLRAGALGYVSKQESPETLVGAIHQILRGEVYLSPRVTNRLLHRVAGTPSQESPFRALSNREFEVFEMIGEGLTTVQIAHGLGLSPTTIATHCKNIKKKLSLTNNIELTRLAVQWVLEGG